MEESSLPSSLSVLENDYDHMTRNNGELDERLFINEDDSLLASGSLSRGSVSAGGVKVCLRFFFSKICSLGTIIAIIIHYCDL